MIGTTGDFYQAVYFNEKSINILFYGGRFKFQCSVQRRLLSTLR